MVADTAGTLTATPCLCPERQTAPCAQSPVGCQQGLPASYAHFRGGLCHQPSAEPAVGRTTGGEGDSESPAASLARAYLGFCAPPEASFADFPGGRTPPQAGPQDLDCLSPGPAQTATRAGPTSCCVVALSPLEWCAGGGWGSATGGGSRGWSVGVTSPHCPGSSCRAGRHRVATSDPSLPGLA